MFVLFVLGEREYLPVVLYLEFHNVFEVGLDELEEGFPESLFAVAVKCQIVSVFVNVYLPLLIAFVHEWSEDEVRFVLRQIISNRERFPIAYLPFPYRMGCSVYAVDDFIQKPQKVFVFYLPSHNFLEDGVLD